MQNNSVIQCPKHPDQECKFVCSKKDCEFGYIICDSCLRCDNQHPKMHKNYIFQLEDFLRSQSKIAQNFIPTLSDTFKDIERRYQIYDQYCENEVKEIDKDFAQLFKIFFTISEDAKEFLKQRVQGNSKKFGNQLRNLKTGFQKLAQNPETFQNHNSNRNSSSSQQRVRNNSQKNFFSMFFANDDEKKEQQQQQQQQNNSDEKCNKYSQKNIDDLVSQNSPLNEMRGKCIHLAGELDEIIKERITYRREEQSLNLFESIRSDFDITCKDLCRRFKGLVEGADPQQLRQSIFTQNNQLINNNNDLQQSGFFSSIETTRSEVFNNNGNNQKQQLRKSNIIAVNNKKLGQSPKTISIDLSQSQMSSTSSFSVQQQQQDNINLDSFRSEMQKKVQASLEFKKIGQFPSFQNQKVIQAIQKYGSLDLNNLDSYFDQLPEQGPFEYSSDKSVYYGHMQNNKRHGRGKLILEDGTYYEGYWKQDIPFGFGRLIRSNGDMYEGDCNNYKACGKGRFESLDGNYKYNGEWQNDKKHGQGHEIVKNVHEYKGQFENDKFSGIGVINIHNLIDIISDSNLSLSQQQQRQNKDNTTLNGKNQQILQKVLYSGNFKNGKISGEGNFEYPNGDKYFGQVLDGLKEGKGILIWEDGRKYEGQFEKDEPCGNGIYFWPDGYAYKGQWQQGKQHGTGIEIDPEGNEQQGIWEQGQWQKWIEVK